MRRILIVFALILFPAFAWAASQPVIYTCAHPDDCFLFMNPDIYNDIVSDDKTVIMIYLTSGDAGQSFNADDASASYPYVRERASIEAAKWIADAHKNPPQGQQRVEVVTIHGHVIERVTYANTVSYFLRLPDGNMYGEGFENYENESLHKFKTGDIKTITPIDGQSAYNSWQELVATLSEIINREITDASNVTLHIAEPDSSINIGDHSDHLTGASAVLEAVANPDQTQPNRCYQIYKHIGYSIEEKPANVDGAALQNKAGSYAVLTAAEREFLGYYHWDHAHLPYLMRNYYSLTTQPNSCDKP